jgi:hypothetical protein
VQNTTVIAENSTTPFQIYWIIKKEKALLFSLVCFSDEVRAKTLWKKPQERVAPKLH